VSIRQLTTIITRCVSARGGDDQFNHTRGIGVDSSNNVYVVHSGNYRIQKFICDNWILQFIDTFSEKTIETIASPS